MMLSEAIAKELSQRLEVPIEVALEMVADIRLMNDDIDTAFYDETENTLNLAEKVCEQMIGNPELLWWLEKRARIARDSLDSPTA
jgi:hypothetical protein